MGDIATNLSAQYGLTGKMARERGNYICRTSAGNGKISKTIESPKEIQRRYAILEQLSKAGFDQIDRIYLSRQGLPFVTMGRDTYVMSRHISGRETDLNSLKDVTLSLECLATFHKFAKGLGFSQGQAPATAPPLFQDWENQTLSLMQALKQINKSSRLSDFDMLVLKNSSYYTEQAAAAAETLKKTGYTALQTQAIAEGRICHNSIKEENLPIMDDVCYITRITDASFDLQLADLSGFIRRYARRSDRAIPAGTLIEIYDRVNPLPESAIEILHAQLIYPSQFIKIIRQYYSKKRGWTPVAIMSRMDVVLGGQPDYDEYIKNLRP